MTNFAALILLLALIVNSYGFSDWIVTDQRVFASEGVPRNRSYTEQPCGAGCYQSVPGCPKSIDGNPWVLFGPSKRCYLTGIEICQTGPCPGGFALNIQWRSRYGRCEPVPLSGSDCDPGAPSTNYPSGVTMSDVCADKGMRYSAILWRCVVRQRISREVGR